MNQMPRKRYRRLEQVTHSTLNATHVQDHREGDLIFTLASFDADAEGAVGKRDETAVAEPVYGHKGRHSKLLDYGRERDQRTVLGYLCVLSWLRGKEVRMLLKPLQVGHHRDKKVEGGAVRSENVVLPHGVGLDYSDAQVSLKAHRPAGM